MDEERTIHNKQIRLLILKILLANQRQKNRQAGGWMRLGMLQRLLLAQGYEVDGKDLHTFCVFLAGRGVECLDIQKVGDLPPYRHEYRITSTGMLVAEQEKKIEGIGIWE